MMFDVISMLVAGLATPLVQVAQAAVCPSRTDNLNLTSSRGLEDLTAAMNCTGVGVFNVTVDGRLQIKQRIEISGLKNVTFTGITDDYYYRDRDDYAGIDAGNISGIFLVSNGSTLSISDLVLNGGYSDYGGAVAVTSSSTLCVGNCLFARNTASAGGAISANRSEIYIDHSDFEHNSAEYGGAVYSHDSNVSMTGESWFYYNEASISGGAVYSYDSNVSMTGRRSFYHNIASNYGGALSAYRSEIYIYYSHFKYNSAEYGGAVYSYDSNVCIKGSSCFGSKSNEASTSGGAVHADDSSVIVDSSWFYDNSAPSSGGAIAVNRSEIYIRGSISGGVYEHTGDFICSNSCVEDCATCKDGCSPEVSLDCTRFSGMATAVTFVLSVTLFPPAFMVILRHLASVRDDTTTETLATSQGIVRKKLSSFLDVLTKSFQLTAIKIVVVVWQIVLQFSAVAKSIYPKEYAEFLSYVSFVSFDNVFMLPCWLAPSGFPWFYGRLLFVTLTPLVVVTVLAIAYRLAKDDYYFGCNLRRTENLEEVRRKHLSAVLGVVFFVYSSASSVVFQTFPCENICEQMVLKADHSITCYDRLHTTFTIYAGVMTAVYPIGIPAFFCGWLVRNRNYLTSERESVAHLQSFRGIWGAYKPTRYYYEVVEFGRRLALSMASVIVVRDSVNQIAIVLLIAVAFLVVSETLSPFERIVDMGLYRWGNGIVLASMFVALLMKANESKYDSVPVYGWVLITANVLMVVAVLAEGICFFQMLQGESATVEVIDPPVRPPTIVRSGGRVHPTPMLFDCRGKATRCLMPEEAIDRVHPDAQPGAGYVSPSEE